MEVRQLRYFVTLAETRHFGRAAARLHIAQSPLSQAIRALEAHLGTALFDRTTRRVDLTAAGEALLPEAVRILESVAAARDQVSRVAAGDLGRLRIGATGLATYRHLPDLVRRLAAELPGLDLTFVTEMLTPGLEAALTEHRIDLAVLRPPVRAASVATFLLARERLVLAVPAAHPLGPGPLDPAVLAGEDFVVYSAPGSVVGAAAERACRAAGFAPRRTHEADQTSVVLALVAAGRGVALLPASVLAVAVEGVRYLDLTDRTEGVEVALAWRRDDPSPALEKALAVLIRDREPPRDDRRLVKIQSVEAVPLALGYRRPFGFASGRVTAADHVIVRITTDDGLVGLGEAPPRPYTYGETAASIVAVLRDVFAPVLVGADPFAREAIRARLGRTVANNAAKGAVDVALWDLVGQACGQPVHVLLGHAADDVRAAHMIGFGTPAEMVDDAVGMRDEHGVTAFKVKVGRGLDEDLAAVRALRDELGDDVELYADANRGWDAATAVVAARRLAELGVTSLEEPNPADDVLARRRIVRESPLPVVGDESTITLGGVARALLDGDCEEISVKVARTGFTDSAKIVGLCEGLGVATAVGNQIDGTLGSVASVALGCGLRALAGRPVEATHHLLMVDDVLTEPPVVVDGRIAARQAPGLGAALDPDKLAHYRLDQ